MSRERPSLLSFMLALVISVAATVFFTLLIQERQARHHCRQLGGLVSALPSGEWECVGVQMGRK